MKELRRIKFVENGRITDEGYDAFNVIWKNTPDENIALISNINSISHAVAGVHIFVEVLINGNRLKAHKYIPLSQHDDVFGRDTDLGDIEALNSKIRYHLISGVVAWRYAAEKNEPPHIELIFDERPQRLSNILHRWQPGEPVLARSKVFAA